MHASFMHIRRRFPVTVTHCRDASKYMWKACLSYFHHRFLISLSRGFRAVAVVSNSHSVKTTAAFSSLWLLRRSVRLFYIVNDSDKMYLILTVAVSLLCNCLPANGYSNHRTIDFRRSLNVRNNHLSTEKVSKSTSTALSVGSIGSILPTVYSAFAVASVIAFHEAGTCLPIARAVTLLLLSLIRSVMTSCAIRLKSFCVLPKQNWNQSIARAVKAEKILETIFSLTCLKWTSMTLVVEVIRTNFWSDVVLARLKTKTSDRHSKKWQH